MVIVEVTMSALRQKRLHYIENPEQPELMTFFFQGSRLGGDAYNSLGGLFLSREEFLQMGGFVNIHIRHILSIMR